MIINGPNQSSENMKMKGEDYIKALEEERSKIQVFQRELPLCLQLVTQAIEACNQQLSGEYHLSECSEQTSSDVVPFEEFIPIKRPSSDSEGEEEHQSKKSKTILDSQKSDWLRSVHLWNQTPDPLSQQDLLSKFGGEKRNESGGAFHPFNKEKGSAPPPSTSCTAETGGGAKKEGLSQRKTRRSWSPELHRRFLQALNKLGGSHVATPKQIRELMKVNGLTNDEVKSHLQKYRLHTRRPGQSTPNNATATATAAQTPQFVVVGGLWVPPEYASVAEESGGAASKQVYAPVAAPPEAPRSPDRRQRVIKPSSQSNDTGSYAAQSCSPATSSSTQTPTVSPAC